MEILPMHLPFLQIGARSPIFGCMKKFLGALLNPIDMERAELIRDGALLANDRGVITYAGPIENAPEALEAETVDHQGLLLCPGFIDSHCHIAQARAVNVRYASLLAWLEKVVFPLEIGYDRNEAAAQAPRFFKHLLNNGTTCAGLYVTVSAQATDEVFQIAKRMGLRAVIGKVMMDAYSPDGLLEDTQKSVDESIALCEKWHNAENGRLRYAFTPRFALTCTMELMKKAGDAARRYDANVMTHVAENPMEVKRAGELFPKSQSYLAVYRDAGLLKKGAVLGHGIYLSDNDWDIIRDSGASIAHCPISNLLLESGIMNMKPPLDRAIHVSLGSDIGAGAEPAMTEVAESAVTSQLARKVLGHEYKLVSPQGAFYMLTAGGAKALDIFDRVGDLTVGKEADLVAIDPRPCLPTDDWPDDLDASSLLYALLFRYRQKAVRAVYVKGEKVHSNPSA